MERTLRIDQLIRAGRCRSAAHVAEEFEVSPRTIERDFDLLRDRFGAPLAYDRQERRWVYTDKAYALPAVQLTEGELIAIFFAERFMHQYRGTPFEKHLRSAFEKLVQALPEQISVDLAALSEAYSFEAEPVSKLDARAFDAVSQAISNRRTLEITYYTQSRDEMTERCIDPYRLHSHRGDWYVIAFDYRRGEVRDFHLGRIRSWRETDRSFTIPPNFDIQSYLSRGFSMVRGKRQQVVELQFDAYQARWIRERKKWHPSEEREDLRDGGLRLRMRLGGLDAIMRFVLQYGGHVVVRKPARLRRMIQQEIRKLSELYGLNAPTGHATARESD
jgi:predicted DNA-binding transcriptional regulator YafY